MWILYFFNRERERREGRAPPSGHTLKYDQFRTPVSESLVVTMTKRLATASAVAFSVHYGIVSQNDKSAGATDLEHANRPRIDCSLRQKRANLVYCGMN